MNATDELPRSLQVLLGTVIAGRYRIESLVGVGGMAAVFKAQHVGLGRAVAVKFLRPDLNANADVAARFDREARSASSFDHPNCCSVFDVGITESGLKFMVMQFLKGQELGSALGGPLPPSQASALALQILRGLDHAHRLGVVHRDLKPDNIFVTRDHEGREILKIVDFGIAKIVDDDKADGLVTKVGIIFGTPAYMSPEQAAGVEVDPRADLYAVGVILQQMLTGRLPFDDRDPAALMRKQLTATPPPLPPSVPEGLCDVVSTLLAKDRERRFASAAATIAALESVSHELRHDPTPWVPLLPAADDDPGLAEASGMDAVDHALRRLLREATPMAQQRLRTGILDAPLGELGELGEDDDREGGRQVSGDPFYSGGNDD